LLHATASRYLALLSSRSAELPLAVRQPGGQVVAQAPQITSDAGPYAPVFWPSQVREKEDHIDRMEVRVTYRVNGVRLLAQSHSFRGESFSLDC
jgi:hypothetical protein